MFALFKTTELPHLWVSLLPFTDNLSHLETALSVEVTKALCDAGAHYALAHGNGTWLAKFDDQAQVHQALMSLNKGLPFFQTGLSANKVVLFFRAAYLGASPAGTLEPQPLMYLQMALNEPGDTTLLVDALAFAHQRADQLFDKFKVRQALHEALATDGFYLCYQPLVSLKTGRIVSAEALLRIRNTTLGPAEFIPEAESSGLIGHLGERALSLASQFHQVVHQAHPHINLAVNVSAAQLGTRSFTEAIKALPRTAGSALELEITESLLLQAAEHKALAALTAEGHPLAMDDFGAGAASLVQLLSTPMTKVKFDRSLLHLTAESPQQLKNLVALAHAQGCTTVVEGIETAEQLALAQAAEADYGQGYLFDKPLDEERLMARLDEQFCLNSLTWKKAE